MSVIGSNILAGASGQGGVYNLTNSLRFRNSASAYLSRTPSSNGSTTTFTFSAWVKRGRLDLDGYLFSAVKTSPTATDAIRFNSNGSFAMFYEGSATVHVRTSALFRDPSAWYHMVVQIDTTQATASNRVKLYCNGSQITALDITNYPSQNATFPAWNKSGLLHTIGNDAQLALYADQYMAEVNFIDGQYLTPSSFGETSASTGVWIPKKYTGTYGTNGFYLPFTDNSALTTSSNAGLGKDFSGNSNYWTTNNISITAGSTYDSMTDVPTLTSATAANFAVLNPLGGLSGGLQGTLTNGNLTWTSPATDQRCVLSTMPVNGDSTGQWYCEVTAVSKTSTYWAIGMFPVNINQYSATSAYAQYRSDGAIFVNGSNVATVASYIAGDVIGMTYNASTSQIAWYKNNSLQTTRTVANSDGLLSYFGCGSDSSGGTNVNSINFGQRPFTYTPPTGFVALNTFNLPTPTIGATASTTANKYMDATLYTGNGSTNTITNAGAFQPDFVWMKDRTNAYFYGLYDSVRGTGTSKSLYSNSTDAEGTNSANQNLTSFNSNGFSLGSTSSTNAINANGDSFVAWQWRASNATAVTNTAGSITSTVSANTTAGFSIVTYTGNATAGATVGHGLGVAPSMIIVKRRNDVVGWFVWHTAFNSATAKMDLNSNDAIFSSNVYLNSTYPTSTLVTLGTSGYTNASGGTYVMYAFAQVAGYSAFGSYTGNGSSDGTFVYTGFRPRFVMIKSSSTGGAGYDWFMWDSSRNTYNVVDHALWANLSDAENTTAMVDFVSNGFKIRLNSSAMNGSGTTFIYMAFAENPFKYANAR